MTSVCPYVCNKNWKSAHYIIGLCLGFILHGEVDLDRSILWSGEVCELRNRPVPNAISASEIAFGTRRIRVQRLACRAISASAELTACQLANYRCVRHRTPVWPVRWWPSVCRRWCSDSWAGRRTRCRAAACRPCMTRPCTGRIDSRHHCNMPLNWLTDWLTLSPVSTGMGDRLPADLPRRYVTKPTRSTQPCVHPRSLDRVPALIGWGEGGNVTSARLQVTLCDPIWHASSRSGEADCRILPYSVSLPSTFELTIYSPHKNHTM